MNSNYHIITTGGTIDAATIDPSGKYTFGQSAIPSIVEQGRIILPMSWTHLPPIDSLYMEDSYRENIFEVCKNTPEDRILITHGTDTLVETAQYLAARVSEKVIVLVGAMVPIRESHTDGYMNLGYAIGVLQSQTQAGVFIAMNGQTFFPRNVRKNRERGVFEMLQ